MGNLSSTPSSFSSSTTTTTTHSFKHEVFLSFRGEDTRHGFISHLYHALRQKQIETFIDDQLVRGDEISPALLRAIEESRISVVIFSKDYASSKWCLRELAEIIKYMKMNKQIVVPVFYHVDPSHVRKQIGSFKKHENELQEEAQKWREALTEASNISGWHSSQIRHESKFVGEIVRDIWKKLNNIPSNDFPGLIGIDKHIEQVISLLCLGKSDFRIVGLWGMGGIGKTTIADAVFNLISYQFENSCYVECFRERSVNYGGLIRLREEVLSEVLNGENLKLGSPSIPLSIKRRINYKKVFIILDDVDNFRKLEILVGGLDRFGPGSRIILTTRDKQVLRNCGLDHHNMYEVKELNHGEALQLFCNYAFKQNHPTEDLLVLSQKVVNYVQGNPLALKVLGSSLYQKSKREWESAVDKLKRILNLEILNVLKISYDGLDDEEKDLFLDIACFGTAFRLLLSGSYFRANMTSDREFSLSGLIDKSLVTMHDYGMIKMHELLRKMGREIVHEESPTKPGNRSRLWKKEDVLCTLKNNNGTAAVQGIFLDSTTIKDVQLSSQVFEKMCNLRILIIKSFNKSTPNLSNGLDYLPHELRYLRWDCYPLEALPSSFNPVNLVELNLSYSNIEQLWEGTKCVPKLKKLNLFYCRHLIRIPDLSDIPLVESIQLAYCTSLLEIHSSNQYQKNLHSLELMVFEKMWNLRFLKFYNPTTRTSKVCGPNYLLDELRYFYWDGYPSNALPSSFSPDNLVELNLCFSNLGQLWEGKMDVPKLKRLKLYGSRHLTRIPEFSNAPCLEYIYLDGCENLLDSGSAFQHLNNLCYLSLYSCKKFRSFPEIAGNIETLYLSGIAIEEVPSSIGNLTRPTDLDFLNCKRLQNISSNICKLKSLPRLSFWGCSNLKTFPEISEIMERLEELDLFGTAIKQLPLSIENLNGLLTLDLSCCENLEMLPSSICNLRFLWDLNVFELNCCGYSGLTLPALSGLLHSLRKLSLKNCHMTEIPDDIGSLSSLEELYLNENDFETLPRKLPLGLSRLEATNCKQLQSLPEAYHFAESVIEDGSYRQSEYTFINCVRLDKKVFDDVFKESLLKIQRENGHEQKVDFRICFPGSDIPNWFTYQSFRSCVLYSWLLVSFCYFRNPTLVKLHAWAIVSSWDLVVISSDEEDIEPQPKRVCTKPNRGS
ncbi:hypothetical protein ACOSQ3_009274 [Xanthoceras sorbifolium]